MSIRMTCQSRWSVTYSKLLFIHFFGQVLQAETSSRDVEVGISQLQFLIALSSFQVDQLEFSEELGFRSLANNFCNTTISTINLAKWHCLPPSGAKNKFLLSVFLTSFSLVLMFSAIVLLTARDTIKGRPSNTIVLGLSKSDVKPKLGTIVNIIPIQSMVYVLFLSFLSFLFWFWVKAKGWSWPSLTVCSTRSAASLSLNFRKAVPRGMPVSWSTTNLQ